MARFVNWHVAQCAQTRGAGAMTTGRYAGLNAHAREGRRKSTESLESRGLIALANSHGLARQRSGAVRQTGARVDRRLAAGRIGRRRGVGGAARRASFTTLRLLQTLERLATSHAARVGEFRLGLRLSSLAWLRASKASCWRGTPERRAADDGRNDRPDRVRRGRWSLESARPLNRVGLSAGRRCGAEHNRGQAAPGVRLTRRG
jgi:hypothetical protein